MSQDPWLLTPGPLTTSMSVKQSMLHDWGSRDAKFLAINTRMRARLVAMIGGEGAFTCVPMQGSGTFAVEAMIGAFVPPAGKLLVLINGAYGKRIAKICEYYKRAHRRPGVAGGPAGRSGARRQGAGRRHGDHPCRGRPLRDHLGRAQSDRRGGARGRRRRPQAADRCHERVRRASRSSSKDVPFDAVAASSNKCIEGIPGLGFVLARVDALKQCQGNAPSLSLDLYEQWQALEKTGQYRFTPPIHCIVAFDQALTEHEEEGGVAGRGARYRNNCKILVDGMRALGFETLLPDQLQAPIIVTFHMPADPRFVFQTFYDKLKDRGYVIYPGKLTVADSFRIGCIGRLDESHMKGALAAVRAAMSEMGVASGSPRRQAASAE